MVVQKTELRGARDLERVLKQLPSRMGKQVLTTATRAGAQVVRKDALARLGGDRQDIITRNLRQTDQSVTIQVGPPRDRFHLMFREFGTSAHTIESRKSVLAEGGGGEVFGKRVQHPGQSARPFLRPAIETKAREAIDKIGERLGAGIERAAKKLAGPLAKSGLLRRGRR